jgi:hypothetical protein
VEKHEKGEEKKMGYVKEKGEIIFLNRKGIEFKW